MSSSTGRSVERNSIEGRELDPIEVEGISFPFSIREQGASVELLKFNNQKKSSFTSWAKDHAFDTSRTGGADDEDSQWGIISSARSKKSEESMFLSLSMKRGVSTR